VPQIVQFLGSINGRLPLATRMLIALSNLFANYGIALAVLVAFLCAAIVAGRIFFPAFGVMQDAFILRLPGIGAVIAKTSLARFAHNFSLLFRSGCDVPSCLHQAQNIVGNRHLSACLAIAAQRVQSGTSLSQALDGTLPAFAIGLLRTGERSGNLAKSLDDIAATYDREAQAATDSFIGMLEPALTLAIGGLLAWTVIAVLGPLYGSLSVLGERM
jgi:type IV pilus assembly protein PilC